jgi:uncharacterized membrane protein YkvA (DUF1232 family)
MFSFFRSAFLLYRALYKDPRSPGGFRATVWAAVAYLLFPFDLIPDVIPVLGQLDDLVAVPLLLFLALRWIKPDLLRSSWEALRPNIKHRDDGIIDVEPL